MRKAIGSTVLLLTVHVCIGTCVWADGFHARIFKERFCWEWRALEPKLENEQFRAAAIRELILILQFTGDYTDNCAPDSPWWMQTEEGRRNAVRSCIEILGRLGDTALLAVWEALKNDIRFDTPAWRTALAQVRAARAREAQALGVLRAELARLPRLVDSLDPARAAGMDREALSDARIQKALHGYREAKDDAVQAARDLHRDFRDFFGLLSVACNDVVPSENYRQNLERVLERLGAVAKPLLQANRGQRHPEVARIVDRLLVRLPVQGQAQLAGPVEQADWRRTQIEWLLIDLGDPTPGSPVATRAATELVSLGLAAVPHLLELLESGKFEPASACVRALELIGHEKFGADSLAWEDWFKKKRAQERNRPANPNVPEPQDEVTIGPRKAVPSEKAPKAPSEREDQEELQPGEYKGSWVARAGRSE